jgi:hypothetical protein
MTGGNQHGRRCHTGRISRPRTSSVVGAPRPSRRRTSGRLASTPYSRPPVDAWRASAGKVTRPARSGVDGSALPAAWHWATVRTAERIDRRNRRACRRGSRTQGPESEPPAPPQTGLKHVLLGHNPAKRVGGGKGHCPARHPRLPVAGVPGRRSGVGTSRPRRNSLHSSRDNGARGPVSWVGCSGALLLSVGCVRL